MPCGTYHFFFAPLLDPSPILWFVRDFLTQLTFPIACSLLLVFPLMALLLASEIKKSIRGSALYQAIFPETNEQSEDTVSQPPRLLPLRLRLVERLKRLYHILRNRYGLVREFFELPAYSRSGIRLITPMDIKHRR